MSNEAVALIGVGGTIAGVIVASAFNLASSVLSRRFNLADRAADHREWYRRTLFEKRLAAAQEAYSWLMRLNEAANFANPITPESEPNKALMQFCRQARQWYDGNCLFLEDTLPSSSGFIKVTNMAAAYAAGADIAKALPPFQAIIEEERALRERVNQLLEAERQSNGRAPGQGRDG